MPKCGECREFPPERKFKCPLRCFGLGEPKADYGVGDCPCFHPAGEPTEGEMLDWMEKNLTRVSLDPGCHNAPWLVCTHDVQVIGKTFLSAIREAMKGGRG